MAGRLTRGVLSKYSTWGAAAPAPGNPGLNRNKGMTKVKGEYVPVYVALGMICLSVSLGLHTAFQQLKHSPSVRLKKQRRESLPEVEEPYHVVQEATNFVKKSLFRRAAHLQEQHPLLLPSDHIIHEGSNLDALRVHVETLDDM